MPAPTNISFATAQALGTLPASVSLQIDDAGANFATYYSFVPATDVVEIGAFGRVDVATTSIVTRIYLGPAGAPSQLMIGGGGLSATDLPLQVPVTAGSTYFVECTPGAFVSSPTTLLLDVEAAPNVAVPVGSFAVNDDTDGGTPGFPLVILSATTDHTVLKFISPFPFGEAGDVLIDGTVCVEDFSGVGVKLYNSAYQNTFTQAITSSNNCRIRTCLGLNKFFIFTNQNPTKLYSMTGGGVLSSAEILTAMTSCSAGAVNNAGTVAYHSFTGTNQPIRQWTIGGAAAANLVAGIANYSVVDILVLSDNKIVVGYYKSTVTRDYQVLVYDAAGATLHTFNAFAVPSSVAAPRLAYAIDDPNSFWVMTHPASTVGVTTFLNIKVSDGSTLHTRNQTIFETGVYTGAATLTPTSMFGASFSCPFWITRVAASPTTETFTIRRQRRFLLPSSQNNARMTIPTLELLLRTGIGLTPDAYDGANVPQGANPQVMMRISKDGGMTWGPERWVSAGTIGQFTNRVRWLQATGNYRNAVCEITVSDPVDWQLLAMFGEPVEGSS